MPPRRPGPVARYDQAEQKKIEARFKALEEANSILADQNAKLERRLRSGRAFTNNPLALATDLDDLGSVKTHLDFEEAPLTPGTPPADVLRLYARDGGGVPILGLVDPAGVETIIPRGVLAQTSSTTLNIITTAETDCLTLAAITGDGVRRVLITVFCWVGGIGGDVLELRIKEGATVLQRQQYWISITGGIGQKGLTILWEFVPTAASHTYKFTVLRTAGSGGNVNAFAGADRPAFIMCKDIGT